MRKYNYVSKKNIRSNYQLRIVSRNGDILYYHFMNHEDELLYIEDDDHLYGIVSVGDLYRYYNSDKSHLEINRNFKFADDIGPYCENIFESYKTIHEVPIVKAGILEGIVYDKAKKGQNEWKKIRETLTYLRRYKWYRNEYIRFINDNDVTFIRFRLSSFFDRWEFDSEEYIRFQNRKKYPNGSMGLLKMSTEEQKIFFGTKNNEEIRAYINEMSRIKTVIKNGIGRMEDIQGEKYNWMGGYRKTCYQSLKSAKRIWLFGPCIISGAYVEDKKTIASYLQKYLSENGYDDYNVINCGLFGPQYTTSRLFTEEIKSNDIVVIIDAYQEKYFDDGKPNDHFLGDLGERYLQEKIGLDNFFNDYAHCNHVVNKIIGKKLFGDIEKYLRGQHRCQISKLKQKHYIGLEVYDYFNKYFDKHHLLLMTDKKNAGSIVMNCNPFTKGHRWLIERACSEVDLLYIFVVEEDLSLFSFQERFEMVRKGVGDLENVRVLPSGQYILSKETFSQYFDKEAVTEIKDMSYDLHIFCSIVAKHLNINCRFVGEEPFDEVTLKYNQKMKELLPQYNMSLIEVPRLLNADNEVISASSVRNLLDKKQYKELKKFLPASTYDFLKEHNWLKDV